MRDVYLYEDCNVLRNRLNIKDKTLLNDAEADYVTYRLKEIALNPLPGAYDYEHLLRMHKYRTITTFCCQYADEIGLNPNRELFENSALYFRTALVAYNAVFDDLGDLSKKEYLIKIVQDAVMHDEAL